MDVDTQKPNKYSSEYHTVYLSRSNKTSKQDFQSIESNDDKDNSSESEAIVYISDLPLNIEDDVQLHRLIETRLEKTFQIIPISVQCYPKLGVGFMCVRNNDIKNRLVNDIQRIVLDSTRDTSLISFNDTIEIISYIVIDITNEKNDIDLPKPNEIRNRWIDLYHGEKSISCEQISVQFPNIYRIISYSFDDLLNAMSNRDFLINNLIARVYIAADCSYFEDLPKSTTKEQLEKAICSSIGKQNISSLSLYIELNKQTNNACIIATDQARSWSTKSFLYLNDKPMSKKENLTCRLLIHPISDIHNDVDEILDEKIFDGQATIIERRDKNLVLEISNKKIYDNCLTVGVLSIKDKPRLKMEVYTTLNNPEDQEIDLDTWYQYDMIRYKPDIMQFIVDLDHPIFRYKWNPDIWFEQFQNSKPQNHSTNFNSRHHSNLSSDKIRHLLQMTVMLNTIGVIRKKSYFIKNKQINLHLNPKLKTIIYNHDSLLEHGQTVQLTTTPYTETKVKVINEDCVTVYGNCCKDYKKPLLLNMANATSPGGGYRKGDGAQEENLFRRSDYFRSLDVDLDRIQEETPERFICSSDEKWETFKSGSIPQNIIDWICTVQPVHRCRREIFESILLHGHVMSRDYMEQLRFPEKVVTSVFQHSEIRRIQCLKERNVAQHVREYIEALVNEEFAKKRYEVINMDETQAGNQLLSSEMDTMKSREDLIKSKEVILSNVISLEEINTIKTKAIEIAQASIKLHSNPAGIGYERDKDLGTNKSVFSVLGPHLGHYYGDVFIVFKREILHHPDANFSLQAATSYASGNCFSWRPWLRSDSTSNDDGVNLFHKTKLHAAITGYEYATALELIAMMSQSLKKKSMNINLDTILKHWLTRDSHTVIEAHLPQLIPLDYIDHIYMSQNIFDSLSTNTRKFIDVTFKGRITKTSHEIELDRFEGPFGPKPDSKIRIEYQDFVIKDIIEKYGQRDIHSISRPIQGTIITIPSSDLTDHYVLPITISQAYKQYKVDYSNVSSDDIPFYIYWQVMNGDMMLTLSNEQINTGKQQPNLRCLISYIAEKPSTKDFHYHENESYLYNGRPFQHEFVINGTKYAIKSRSFYIGCNTDDFMTFCLEIQRSTGKVILSHAGPNSIYNHEQISSTFSKSDLDLNQLNYIHVSARARTVPIRNVFVTFEKQPKPLDETDSNVQLDSSGLPDNSSDNNNTTILSTKDTVNQQDQSSVNILLICIRYSWLILLILLCESFTSYEYSSNYIQNYQQIKQIMRDWCIKHGIRREFRWFIILTIPFLLDLVLTRFFYPLLLPVLFIIQYNWLILIFILDGMIIKQKYFLNFTRKYQEIKTNIDNYLSYNLDAKYTKLRRRLSHWHRNDNFENRVILFSILIGPLIIQILFLFAIPILKFILLNLWKSLIYIIYYSWVLLIVLITESIIIKHQYFPKYIKLYDALKKDIIQWSKDNKFRRVLMLISIFISPFILEMCFIWFVPMIKLVFFLLWQLCQLITIYCWPILIIIISEILKENKIFSSYTKHYELISEKIQHWIGQKHCKIRSMTIREILLFLLTKLFLFMIRYCWLILIIAISAILHNNKIFLSYTKKFDSFMIKIDRWTGQ
ncbi:unnamed protein product, partial [Rotaria sp. Silwood1]